MPYSVCQRNFIKFLKNYVLLAQYNDVRVKRSKYGVIRGIKSGSKVPFMIPGSKIHIFVFLSYIIRNRDSEINKTGEKYDRKKAWKLQAYFTGVRVVVFLVSERLVHHRCFFHL